MAERVPGERDLTVLRYLRAHQEATAAAIAETVLGAPRTTFGRTLKLEQVERELADLVARKLLIVNNRGGKAVFAISDPGRQLIRDTALESHRDPTTT